MSKPTVLLTGANGFLGSHLLEALIKQGYQVVVLKRSTSNLWRIEHLAGQYKSYDVDSQPLEQAFEEQRIYCVIHTACHYGRNGDPVSQIVESNLMFGLRVLDACLKFEVETFINTDTFFNNKNFNQKYLGAYTLSKKQFVEWLQLTSERIQVVNLKLQHIYGPKDEGNKFIPWIVLQLKQNVDSVKLTSGQQKRDFIFIDDVVSAYLIILERKSLLANFSEYDVGTGKKQTLKSFVKSL
ncbi:MAG: NAD-dependent epimerase/dehydratase family protein, partial [Methyloprofundus sp.]|nr:NAD-dependent epimerase/dehydratase family protein [Methyloprofundus sp.]